MTPEPLRPHDPVRLGGYTVIARLGEGGQGAVYLATDQFGEQVAIKVLRTGLAGDTEARARFTREVETAKRVARFCTAQVLDHDVTGDQPYVVSEYVEGRSLKDLVLAGGPLSGGTLDRLAIGTVTALAAIHAVGIVHRDFKPGNVMMGSDGPRVIDFGIARVLDTTQTATSMVVGTPSYMAPEQFAPITGRPIDGLADMFAWASTIAFAATGRPPFGSDSAPAIMHRVLSEKPDLRGIPEGRLRSVLEACFARDPALRPTAHNAMRHLLGQNDDLVRNSPEPPTDDTAPTRGRRIAARRRPRVRPVVALGVGIVGVAALIAAVILVPGIGNQPSAAPPGASDCSSRITVAASPDVAPVLRRIVNVSPRCPRISVSAASSGDVLAKLEAGSGPDLWVPESSAWLRAWTQGTPVAKRVRTMHRSVAASPLVLAVNEATAAELSGSSSTWASLASDSRVVTVSPSTSGVAFAGLQAAYGSASGLPSPSVLSGLKPDSRSLGTSLAALSSASGVRRGVPATEQQVLRLRQPSPGSPMSYVPSRGTVLLDYPLVAVTSDSRALDAGRALGRALSTQQGRKMVRDEGFRWADKPSLSPAGSELGDVRLLSASSTDADAVRRAWSMHRMRPKIQIAVDRSKSMYIPGPGTGMSAFDLASVSVSSALGQIPDESPTALVTFAETPPISPAWNYVFDLKPLTDRRRAQMSSFLKEKESSEGGPTETLHNTFSGLYERAIWQHESDRTNWVVILADGNAWDEQRNAKTSDDSESYLAKQIGAMRSDQKDVKVLVVGLGVDADVAHLKRLAGHADGTAVTALNADQAEAAIIDGMLRECGRVCED